MYGPHFRLVSFETIPHGYKIGVLEHLLEALTAANVAYLLIHPHTPNLYESPPVTPRHASGAEGGRGSLRRRLR
jgi:hypothetical protein